MAAGPRSTLAACHLFPFPLVLARPCFPVLDAEPPLLLFFFLCFSTAPPHARTGVFLTSPTACGSALPHLARRAATPRSAPRCPRPPWPSIFPARYGTPPPCSRLPVLPCAVALLFFLARAHPRSVSGPLPFPHVPSRASDAAPRHRNSPRRRDSQRLVRATLNCSTSAATGRARARKARAGAGPLCRHGPLAEPGRPCTPASRRPRSGARSSRRPPVAVPLPWCSVLRMKVRRLLLQG